MEFNYLTNGWKAWADLIVNSLSNLGKQLEECFQKIEEIENKTTNKLEKQNEDLNNVKINLKKIEIELINLKEAVEKTKNICDTFYEKENQQNQDISSLKVKAGMWGGLAGVLGAIGSVLLYLIAKVK